ncbi:OmpA family protein [Vibrio sp. Isolate31]|uniref:OmpA family protein n=1 Tax=unclassified Vibrio TaxID=2614977 RepID=UPI001EFE4EF1|nr:MULTISPECIES: OmpA family protein [unclassified Vibrio]MCG9554470.1 OmpA family protein [Vibrio sp. Isolate32]MCG9599937.1 OmpA family protein [Vibrio sp. Isolate31]
MSQDLFGNETESSESNHWLSVSDLMAGLMVIFLLISVALMNRIDAEKRAIKEMDITVSEAQVRIHIALQQEFSRDFSDWHVELAKDKSLSIDFYAKPYHFDSESNDLPPALLNTLKAFFPRYLNVLEQHKEDIQAIQIEGHTSSNWDGLDKLEAYKENMALSQRRANAVFKKVVNFDGALDKHGVWVMKKLAAIGYGPSQIRIYSTGKEDSRRSRRISFKVVTKSEIKAKEILEKL